MHVYDPRFPPAPTSPFPPPVATLDTYRAVLRRLGVDRCVVVQPMAYGADNRCTLEAVATMGVSARAVVVIEPGVPEAEIVRLVLAGARGLRVHMFPGGLVPWPALESTATRGHAHGLHIQLQLDGRELAERESVLRRLPGPLVIDHVGRFMEPVSPDHPAFRALLRLVDTGRVWVKLSAPYESSRVGPPTYADVGILARTLAAHAPERMLWASNWPHPSAGPARGLDDAALLDLMLEWAPDASVRQKIFVENPARLYGF
jgi:D-galactarolactone isomerase